MSGTLYTRRMKLPSCRTLFCGAGLLCDLHGQTTKANAAPAVPGRRPNIPFILVDELRFPSVFPQGINDIDGFLSKFMPETALVMLLGLGGSF